MDGRTRTSQFRRSLYWVLICLAAAVCLSSLSSATAQASQREHQVAAPDSAASQTAGVDLDVTFINRTPLYHAYCVQYTGDYPALPYLCPGTETDRRWPEPGELVTFTAHIVNKGSVTSPSFAFAWAIDDSVVATGTLPALAPAAEVTTTYAWQWGHGLSADGQRALGEHTVRLTVDPANLIPETHESNNSLLDHTQAMSFQVNFTPAMHAAYNIPVAATIPASAEDWIQKQIARMNANFAEAAYPATPEGAALRVRLNHIGVVASDPGGDGLHDGGWFINADYRHGASGWYDPATDIDWALIHELSHQVSLIDLYALDLDATSVYVTDRLGQPVNMSAGWERPGLMGGGDIAPYTDSNRYSGHTAGGADTYAGYRNGFYGSHLFDIPLQNTLRVLDAAGNPAQGVQVTVYQRTGPWDWPGHLALDATADMSGTTDLNGLFLLPNRSAQGGTVTPNGHTLHDNPFGVVDVIGTQGVLLVRLTKGNHEEFHWLDITTFNLAYWQGYTSVYTLTLQSHVPASDAPLPPNLTRLTAAGGLATFCWQPSPSTGVVGYRIYRATSPRFTYTPVTAVGLSTCYSESLWPGGYDGKIYAVTALDSAGRESGFSDFGWAPTLANPAAVVILPDEDRLVLDPRNGHALLRQGADGRYLNHVGSVHYHLENSHYAALDANDRLLFSHPGDWYDPRHSVRVADLRGDPLLEFGQQGAAPGEFQNPTGVASWGDPCSIAGPYADDDETRLLLHFDGSYTGADGEPGTATGTSFVPGRYGSGVLVDNVDSLTYATAGNIERTQGAVEFWLKPNWPGNDLMSYTFFEVGDTWFNRLRVMKDGANNLRFMVWDGTTEYGVAYNVADWQAGEWHHVAATWQGTTIALYADGVLLGSESNAQPPDVLGSQIYVGRASWEGQQANAIIDELRISAVPRVGNSDVCGRILVADSGNHRLQAFDSLGNFLTSFGAYGSGPGAFNSPQGLAVTGDGRVLVADQGNNRVVVLSFDGATFAAQGSYTAAFNAPTGVAVTPAGQIVVADTGNNRIVLLDAMGAFIRAYAGPNDGSGGVFAAPRGVVVQPDGVIVVADTGNQRVVSLMPWEIWLAMVRR